MQDDSSFLQRRALPAGRQYRAIAVVAAVVIVVALLWSVLGRRSSAAAGATAAAPAAGQVKLSSEQLATLGSAIVTATPFHDAVVADGQIAVNADTTTQVFSPYSGRVLKVLAGIGEKFAVVSRW
jgi:cobalt-zinc-cadmium efflux system membrane fusion protein